MNGPESAIKHNRLIHIAHKISPVFVRIKPSHIDRRRNDPKSIRSDPNAKASLTRAQFKSVPLRMRTLKIA